ncbi:MAG: ABC transporter permease [Candidatus Heimdallarchaeota archaeon]|nr:ABC transporter permease [Candidatus Heimdallarchaeota archaeon]
MTQLKILLFKDVKSLFKQKAVIGTLLIPMLLMIGFGLIPLLSDISDPFEVVLYNEDTGIDGLNLGSNITTSFVSFFVEPNDLELKLVDNYEDFIESENGIWLPSNFSRVANDSHIATYFTIVSDTNLRSEAVMFGIAPTIIETVVSEELLKPIIVPKIQVVQVYSEADVAKQGIVKDRGALAFPLAYMSFLILILSSTAIRITGFSAEKNAGMMELLLSSIKNRKELVISKLLTGVIYGLATVLSYLIGALISLQITSGFETDEEGLSGIIFSNDILTNKNLMVISLLFIFLIFTSMEIMLTSQLLLGKEAGDRVGSTANMILSFLFYFSLISDPLSETPAQIINPFFWPFKTALNIAFNENWINSFLYLLLNVSFLLVLLRIMTYAIEKEKIIFDE